jgi:hypothetical protein
MKPITLYDHEIRRLLTGAPVLVVRPMKEQPPDDRYQLARLMSTTGDTRNEGKLHWLISETSDKDYGKCTREYFPDLFIPGQSMWVRETWGAWPDWYGGIQRDSLRYKATDNKPDDPHNAWVWRSPVTMPRKYSRLSIIVSDVAVKQVQDVTEDEAEMTGTPVDAEYPLNFPCPRCMGEGVHPAFGANYGVTELDCRECDTHKKRHKILHNSHFPDHPYSANPHCWLATVRES